MLIAIDTPNWHKIRNLFVPCVHGQPTSNKTSSQYYDYLTSIVKPIFSQGGVSHALVVDETYACPTIRYQHIQQATMFNRILHPSTYVMSYRISNA